MSSQLSKIKQLTSSPLDLQRFVSEVFKKIDSDKSGFLDKMEAGEVLTIIALELGFNKPSLDDTADIVRMIDQNGDEKLSKAEFQGIIEKVIRQLGSELLSKNGL